MFLVEDQRPGFHNFIFTQLNPKIDGYNGPIIEGVTLDYDVLSISSWPDGWERPQPQLGRDPANVKHYKVFKYPHELLESGFEFVHYNAPVVVYSWHDFKKMFPMPKEIAESVDAPEWFEYLDEIDTATLHRQQKVTAPVLQPDSTNERIAEWIANRHLSADASVRQIWYLPSGAPAGEIRLLEVSNRVAGSTDAPEPIDFGVEVAGKSMKLFVADVTGEQLERMRTNPMLLPSGWRMESAKLFQGRRR